MLLSFSFENFLSFRDRVKLNFRAGTIKDYPENVYLPHFDSQLKMLKSIALYGANSSGKSNIIKAFAFYRHFILESSKESNSAQTIPVSPFLLSEQPETLPSLFEAVFFVAGVKYKYGFQVDKYSVVAEWLFSYPSRKEEKLFLRGRQEFSFERKFQSASKTKLETLAEFTRPNSLYLSVLAQFNFQIAQDILKWLDSILVVHDTDHKDLINYTAGLMEDVDYRKYINDIMKNSGLDIQGVESTLDKLSEKTSYSVEFLNTLIGTAAKKYTIKTRHYKYGVDNKPTDNISFDLVKNESLGTQKFFGILGPVLKALKESRLLLVDEIDSRLHSGLLEHIISLFNSIKYNPNGSQLIFTSHNTKLLKDNMRRDQMVFVEKKPGENSTFESLYAKKPSVRNDATFEKDYLAGKYGAIPVFSTQMNLFEK